MQSREGLWVSGLTIERGGRPLVAGLTFRVAPGTALAVTGRNGIGKSTLLRGLAGLLRPTAGTVDLGDRVSERGSVVEHCHYLGHANGLKAALTAVENLRFRQRWSGSSGLDPHAALAAVDLVHAAEVPAGLLSAGQKRRIALAGLLVAQRPVWLLDEPATALDAAAEATFVGLLAAHLAAGGLAVLALHAPLDLPMATLRLGPA